MDEKDFWGLGTFGAFLLLWYRRIVILKALASVVLAVLKLIRRSSDMEIAQLKSLVSVGAALGSVAGATMADGKVDVKDLALLPRLIPVFPALLAIDFAQVVPEAKDLSEAEALELVEHYKQQFDIPQDDLEVKIETVLSLCVRLAGIVGELIAAFKKPAA
jgi:hypothetical protein